MRVNSRGITDGWRCSAAGTEPARLARSQQGSGRSEGCTARLPGAGDFLTLIGADPLRCAAQRAGRRIESGREKRRHRHRAPSWLWDGDVNPQGASASWSVSVAGHAVARHGLLFHRGRIRRRARNPTCAACSLGWPYRAVAGASMSQASTTTTIWTASPEREPATRAAIFLRSTDRTTSPTSIWSMSSAAPTLQSGNPPLAATLVG